MVQTDAVEGVQESKTTLDLMGLDHTLENVTDGQGLALTSEVISNSKDGTKVIRGVTPLCCQEAVVEVQPTDLSTNVEGTTNGIQLVVGSRNLGPYRQVSCTSLQAQRDYIPLGTTVPSTTGPSKREQVSNLKPSRPHPMVSIKQSLAVSRARSDSILKL